MLNFSGLCVNISKTLPDKDIKKITAKKVGLEDTGLDITSEFKLFGIKYIPRQGKKGPTSYISMQS